MAKRRINGDGALYKRADGRWECRLTTGRKADGKPLYKYISGATQKEVKAKLKQHFEDCDMGIVENKYTFSEWAKTWYDSYADYVSPTTYESYRYTIRILNGYFGSMRLMDIKTMHVEAFLRKMKRDGRSSSSISKLRGMLFQILNKAEANDFIRKNPVRFAEKMRRDGMVKPKDAFTTVEVRKLMSDLPEDKIGLTIRVMLGSGLRTQEFLALCPEHIEPDGSMIHVRQALKLVKGVAHIGSTKSRDGMRDVPIATEFRPYLVALRAMHGETFVWQSTRKDIPINPTRFRDYFRDALEQVDGVRKLTPHSTRHTYVSQLQANGVDIDTIKSLVGHADIQMTEHYLHVQSEVKLNAVERLNALLNLQTASQPLPETLGNQGFSSNISIA